MALNYETKLKSSSLDNSLKEAGYTDPQIEQMTNKEALISLTVAILRGIKPEVLDILDIVLGEIDNTQEDLGKWDPEDIEAARAMLWIVAVSKITPKPKAGMIALYMKDLPPKNPDITAPITLDEILGAYALATTPAGTIN